MKKVIGIISMAMVISFIFIFPVHAADKDAKTMEWKVKGQLIAHPDRSDVKVMDDNWDTITVAVDGKTKINGVVDAKLDDIAKEDGMPKGEVTFTVIDGKPVARKVVFSSGQSWEAKKKKKK